MRGAGKKGNSVQRSFELNNANLATAPIGAALTLIMLVLTGPYGGAD
jgi:hypothetical protein